MRSQRTDQGPIISREGLLRLVEVVERVRAHEAEKGALWVRQRTTAPDPGDSVTGTGAVGEPAGGEPAGCGALVGGDRGPGGGLDEPPDDTDGDGDRVGW